MRVMRWVGGLVVAFCLLVVQSMMAVSGGVDGSGPGDLSALGLSKRAEEALREAGYGSVDALWRVDRETLIEIDGIGEKTADGILAAVAAQDRDEDVAEADQIVDEPRDADEVVAERNERAENEALQVADGGAPVQDPAPPPEEGKRRGPRTNPAGPTVVEGGEQDDVVLFRNETDKPVMLGERYLFPEQTRKAKRSEGEGKGLRIL